MKKKILIVEDNSDSREILGLFVTKIGHQPIKACNSKEAITVAESRTARPNLHGSGSAGYSTESRQPPILKQNPKTSHIPVVAVTAWMSALWEEKSFESGYCSLLTKETGLASNAKADNRGIHCESLT